MRIWLILLSVSVATAAQPTWQDNVLVQHVGGGYLYIFPAVDGRNPAGVINVGSSITVMYSLHLIGRAKTRFIGMDATRTEGISPRLTVMHKTDKSFGFFVRDTNQSTLQIIIDPSFMKKIEALTKKQSNSAIASQGNLNVTLKERRGVVVIKDVRLE